MISVGFAHECHASPGDDAENDSDAGHGTIMHSVPTHQCHDKDDKVKIAMMR